MQFELILSTKTIMKYLLSLAFVGICFFSQAQTHQVTKLWETGPIFAVPESVFADMKNKTLYVSLINGSPSVADGKGGVAKLSLDGSKADTNWVTGLNAPKGMGKFGKKLYVADLAEVVVIDIRSGKILQKIAVPGARVFNDITIDSKGIIYVSDSAAGKIYRIVDSKAEIFIDSAPSVNGLKSVGNELFVLTGRAVQKVAPDKSLVKLADGLVAGLDGIEPMGNGDFLISSWSGVLQYLYADGKFETLLDTRADRSNIADIGYDPKKKIIYVPTFSKRTVVAFQLN